MHALQSIRMETTALHAYKELGAALGSDCARSSDLVQVHPNGLVSMLEWRSSSPCTTWLCPL